MGRAYRFTAFPLGFRVGGRTYNKRPCRNRPETEGETIDATIDNFIKQLQGQSVIVTGWVLVAATAEGAVSGAPLGFTLAHSKGMPTYSTIGLLESAVRSIHDTNLFLAWEDRQNGANPPF